MATKDEIRAMAAEERCGEPAELYALGEEAVAPLVEILRDDTETARARQTAAVVLGQLGAAEAAPALRDCLNAADPVLRLSAAHTLAALFGDEATPEIAPLADDADPGVRKVVLKTLGQVGGEEALATLRKRLSAESDAKLRGVAKEALAALGDREP